MLSEAFSRVLIRPANVTAEHIEEAIRSANLMLIDFSTKGVHQYQLIETVISTVIGQASYDLPAGTIDVWHAILRRDNRDTPVWPMARSDYHSIPNKDNPGRPFNYFSERGKVGEVARTITLWPVPDKIDSLRIWVWVFAESVGKMAETLSVSKEWFDAYASALTARLAEKYAPTLFEQKMALAAQAFMQANRTGRERTTLRLRMRGYMGRGRVV
jgi:hypothetical protein